MLGAPSLSPAPKLGGALQCLVAARLSDLAAAIVDVPLGYARGEQPGSKAIATAVIKPGSPEEKTFAQDFAG